MGSLKILSIYLTGSNSKMRGPCSEFLRAIFRPLRNEKSACESAIFLAPYSRSIEIVNNTAYFSVDRLPQVSVRQVKPVSNRCAQQKKDIGKSGTGNASRNGNSRHPERVLPGRVIETANSRCKHDEACTAAKTAPLLK